MYNLRGLRDHPELHNTSGSLGGDSEEIEPDHDPDIDHEAERNGGGGETTEEDEEEENLEEEEESLLGSHSSSTEHLNLINQHHHHLHHHHHHLEHLSNNSSDKIINNNSISPGSNNNNSSGGGFDGLTGSFLLGHLSRGEGNRGGNLSPSLSNHSAGSQRKYPCGQCGRSLTDFASLQRHLRYGTCVHKAIHRKPLKYE